MTTIDKDDPRLTAYALGELDEPERAAFEQVLADDPEAQAEVDAIRAFGGELTGEMTKVAPPTLTDAQRAEIARACAPIARAIRPWLRPVIEYAAAASMFGIGVGFVLHSYKNHVQITVEGSSDAQRINLDAMQTTDMELQFQEWSTTELDAVVRSSDMEFYEEQERVKVMLRELQEARLQVHGRDTGEVRYDHFKTAFLDPAGERIREILELEYQAAEDKAKLASALATDADLLRREHERLTRDFRLEQSRLESQSRPGEARITDLERRESARPSRTPVLPPVYDNPVKSAQQEPLSTFSIDVDTAAYSSLRSALQQRNALPSPAAVRIEELINYFPYDDAGPTDEHPFATHVEVAGCPWKPGHQLVRVAIKGREMQTDRRPSTNLVFLVDVSGSMAAENRLPLVKRSLALLIEQLGPTDRVSMVVYAGASGLVLPPTPGDRKVELLAALDRLSAGGSTNGGAGIQLAYDVASRHFAEGGVNRVVLCTDGDWNVGVRSESELQALIEQKARSKVFLTVLGFGMSHDDAKLELLADKGNGNYAFVDTVAEARKVLVDQLTGTLVTIAKDVKVQVDWNPAAVRSYRLIGYENRVLAAKDFADDTKDAGEIGAGHSVTALYEVEPAAAVEGKSLTLMTLRLRYKQPEGDVSKLIERSVVGSSRSFDGASNDFRFAAAVASFGMLLRDSPHRGQSSLALVEALAAGARGHDRHGHRAEFVDLVKLARRITGR